MQNDGPFMVGKRPFAGRDASSLGLLSHLKSIIGGSRGHAASVTDVLHLKSREITRPNLAIDCD